MFMASTALGVRGQGVPVPLPFYLKGFSQEA